MKTLRPYQQVACDYIDSKLEHYTRPFVYVLPTGGGKSLVVAEIAKRWGKVLVLTLSKELCSQDYEECVEQGIEASVYSASLKSKEVGPITIATVLSAYKHPWLFTNVDVVVIDETDSLNPAQPSTTFMKLLVEINKAKKGRGEQIKVVGLTATPWRTVQKVSRRGRWYETTTMIQPLNRIPCQGGFLWSSITEGLTTKQAMEMGYLTPVQYFSDPLPGKLEINSTGADYTEDSLDAWGDNAIHRCLEVMLGAERNWNIKSGIVALPFIRHAEALQALCEAHNVSSVVVSSKTPQKARDEAIRAFKNGEIKWLVQCLTITIGFNSPITDCLVWCRPTLSLRLWVQCCGRVMRLAEGKKKARVVDLTGTLRKFGRPEEVHLGVEDRYKTTIIGEYGVVSGKPLSSFVFSKRRKEDGK